MSDTAPLSRRPEDTPFKQQRLPAWQPILTPFWVIVTFLTIGAVFLPLGIVINKASNDVVEYSKQYDGDGWASTGSGTITDGTGSDGGCALSTATDTATCKWSITIDKQMTAPIYVYYQLDNFYQNHRRYVKSRDNDQLLGETVAESTLEDNCSPLYSYEGKTLNPCGLIANSYFNDVFRLADYTMNETGIAWATDVEYRYDQPEGFCYTEWDATDFGTLAECLDELENSNAGCSTLDLSGIGQYTDPSTGIKYCYFYPNSNSYYYLYERYPQISPIKGVKDEHFIVWMRTAALPNFRKLYGIINTDLEEGTTLTFDIDANFFVQGFEGKKYIVISTTSWFGGANSFLGLTYIVVGSVCLFLAIIFLGKQVTCPRKLGDTRYLGWKEA